MGPEGPSKSQHPTFCYFNLFLTVLAAKSRQSRKSHLEPPKSPSTFRFNTYVSEITSFYIILPLLDPFQRKNIVAGSSMVNELSMERGNNTNAINHGKRSEIAHSWLSAQITEICQISHWQIWFKSIIIVAVPPLKPWGIIIWYHWWVPTKSQPDWCASGGLLMLHLWTKKTTPFSTNTITTFHLTSLFFETIVFVVAICWNWNLGGLLFDAIRECPPNLSTIDARHATYFCCIYGLKYDPH